MTNPNSLTVAEARRLLCEHLAPVSGWEVMPIRRALDRVLYRDIIAPFDVPAHTNSAMDGYAVRAADLSADQEVRLTVVGRALAGNPFSGTVGATQAVRIMTGAVLPHGADTVVVQERVRLADDGGSVLVPPGQQAGQNVRRAGEDLACGKPALKAGQRLGPSQLGLIASLGIGEVAVRRRLRVAFFSTGDEIASLNRPLGPGEVYDSNRYTIFGMLTRLGVELIDMGVVRDDPQALESALRDASLQADVILTSGGVSVGEADYVRELMARLGDVRFWKLDIKPGRPMASGRIGNAWLFGLPGNPVAVMVTFYQIVVDALLRLMGCDPLPEQPLFRVACVSDIDKSPRRREFPRGILFTENGEWKVRLAGNQGSGILSSMSNANCFIVLPESGKDVKSGDFVEVQPFEGIM
ncbi:gephyrin-like molybdotransferase Glp [Propionivibrio soli]|uniref:molybdopterin molybdotransferase MoeA n=1 Tax=Propionivibrio soli TaxID=2976531 RepID=UPI0021E7B46E|nr:gephyrin-like molybdotransferase Glp [Propionivibrio soli]